MKNVTIMAAFVSLFTGGLLLAPKLDAWNQATTVTFNAPVEIPGQVLSPGSYVFKLMDSQSSRNIVQIFNRDQTKLFATILALPDYRLKPTGKTVITFKERPSNSPQAIKAWFYPGDNYGQEFVYPKARAMQLAKTMNQPVPSMPENLEANTKMPAKSASEPSAIALKKAPVKEQQPAGSEVEVGTVITTPPQVLAQNTAPAKSNSSTARELPKTASELPLVVLLGLVLVGAGISVGIAARRLN